jgi:hypothetical protein
MTKKERLEAFKIGLAALCERTGVVPQIMDSGENFELSKPVLGYVLVPGWPDPADAGLKMPSEPEAPDTPQSSDPHGMIHANGVEADGR